MTNYLLNLKLWWTGWTRFHEITNWQDGWGPTSWKWFALYATDYLACPLILGGPVVSLSRYWYDFWGVQGSHFANAGRPLWGSVRSEPWVRVAVPVVWVVLFWLI